MTRDQQIQFGMIGAKSSKPHKVTTPAEEKKKRDSRNAETDLQTIICRWLREKHILFICDFAAGLHLSPFLAGIRSDQSSEYKMPDLYIFDGPCLLVIENKVKPADLFLVDGKTLKSEHVQLQYETLLKLRALGYNTDFGVGEYDIKTIITQHLAGSFKPKEIIPFRQPTRFDKSNKSADEFFGGQGI